MTDSCHPFTEESLAHGISRPFRRHAPRRQVPVAVFTGIASGIDPLLLLAGSVLSWTLTVRLHWDALDGGDLLAAVTAAWAATAGLQRGDAYRLSRLVSLGAQFRWLAIALLGGAGALALASTVVHIGVHPAPSWIATWLTLNTLLVGTVRIAIVQIALRLRRDGRLAQRVALVGATHISRTFAAGICGRNENDIDIVGIYDDAPDPAALSIADTPFLGDVSQLISDAQRGFLDAVVLTLPADQSERIARIGGRLGHLALDVFVAPDLASVPFREVDTFAGQPVGLLARRPLSDWQVVQKTLFDRTVSALLLLLFAPSLLLIAALIRLDSPGPVLFRQRRIGFNNLPFDCLKFRTMYHHMADPLADRQTTRRDPRVTPVGRWLRRLSLDELPQLLNVLLGEMSLVGPRPHALNTKAASRLFQDVVADYARRHRVRPGITGWAQVNGWRGETTTEEEIEQRVLHDLHYIQNWSLLWDLRIMLMTTTRICADPKAF